MTDYTLTTGDDNFPGTAGPDTFSGPAGGTDTLNGAGGDDTFTIDDDQLGTIDGGTGTDTVGVLHFQLSTSQLSFSNVEILDLTNVPGLSASAAQVNAFSTILVDSSLPEFKVNLEGLSSIILPGEGTLEFFSVDFSTRFISSTLLKVSAHSAGTIKGTGNADELKGGSTTEFTDGFHHTDYGSSLYGLGGDDRLIGSGASDHLDGGTGADFMQGGGGGDGFVVDNVGDVVVAGFEGGTSAGPLYNGIAASISIDLRDTTHFQGVIRVVGLTGTSNINATGNALDNELSGNSGTNILDGGAGNDKLYGGLGDDLYRVDSAADLIFDASAGGGIDRVVASKNYVLNAGARVEWIQTDGSAGAVAINLYGNEFANRIIGNAAVNILSGGTGNDVINGGAGNDALYGGLGNDILAGAQGNDAFFFDTTLNAATNVDQISDFTNAAGNNDVFRLDNAVFAGLPAGVLAANRFHVGAGAHDADDRIIYNQATGDLFFDSNGNAAGGATKFAHLSNHAVLTSADFVVF
jgi:serralysin